ncbi:MAG: ubiquitin carboxyl-terminal hydrolase, partial [Verrucomicrobia bacterium]|nr:ubiquitin carboxyl-terminal hydrolase [Verrucomicrobiota bacterium]
HGDSGSSSEGMTNDRYSCWMISVIQALRNSAAFRKEFAPQKEDKNALKTKLFTLFDIAEGKNGEERRPVHEEEIRSFKRLAIEAGLKAPMDGAFLEMPFLQFLLQKIGAEPIEYYYSKKKKKYRETIFTIPLKNSEKKRSLQSLMKEDKIAFLSRAKTPAFLPIYLDRPLEKHTTSENRTRSEFSRTQVTPSYTLEIPIAKDEDLARYRLVSIVVGRDSSGHAYSYVFEKDDNNKSIWVEYNDSDVRKHLKPETKKRRAKSNLTPYDDAVKHGLIFIYELEH